MSLGVERGSGDSGPHPVVLYLIDSLAVGGAERSLVALAHQYRTLGVELHVAYLRPRTSLAEDLEAAGVVLHPIPGPQRRLSWIRKTRRLIGEIEPDVVHTTLFEADLVGRGATSFRDVPLVSSVVTDSYGPEHVANPDYRRWKVRLAQLADLISARRVDQFHAVSSNAANLMSRRLWIDRGVIEVVPRGRDPDLLGEPSAQRRQEARARVGLEPETPLIVAAARHFHVKGLDVLIEALPAIVAPYPGTKLLVAGREGPATQTLRSLAHANNVEADLMLMGYRADAWDLIAAADVFVLPSRAEGSPGALLEAMALRIPVVAADIPSVREVAGTPPVMTLVPREDPPALAKGVIELLADEHLRARLASDARRRFLDHYTVDEMGRRMLGVYSKAVRARRGDRHLPARAAFEQAADRGYPETVAEDIADSGD